VNGPRDQLLARAVLAEDQDAAVRRRRRGDLAAELDDGGAGADDLVSALDALAELRLRSSRAC
jgi:hypothetical protein